MSCFKIPDSLCDDLTSMIRNFWWGQKSEEKKISWVSWEKMGEPKACGGMGFKNLKCFNLALLAKQGWRLQLAQDSLVFRVLKAKYFPRCDFIHTSLGHNPSYTWRSIMVAQDLVKEGMMWRVGNGSDVKVWGDRWLPSSSSHVAISPRLFLHEDTRVGKLIDIDAMCWKSSVVDSIFLPHEAEAIKSIPFSVHFPLDKLVWAEMTNGKFTIKSAYHFPMKISFFGNRGSASDCSYMRRFWRSLWRLLIPHKVRHFAWRVCREALPTKVNLSRRKVLTDDSCEWRQWRSQKFIFGGAKHIIRQSIIFVFILIISILTEMYIQFNNQNPKMYYF